MPKKVGTTQWRKQRRKEYLPEEIRKRFGENVNDKEK